MCICKSVLFWHNHASHTCNHKDRKMMIICLKTRTMAIAMGQIYSKAERLLQQCCTFASLLWICGKQKKGQSQNDDLKKVWTAQRLCSLGKPKLDLSCSTEGNVKTTEQLQTCISSISFTNWGWQHQHERTWSWFANSNKACDCCNNAFGVDACFALAQCLMQQQCASAPLCCYDTNLRLYMTKSPWPQVAQRCKTFEDRGLSSLREDNKQLWALTVSTFAKWMAWGTVTHVHLRG